MRRNPLDERRANQLEAKRKLAERLDKRSQRAEARSSETCGASSQTAQEVEAAAVAPKLDWRGARINESTFRYYGDDAKTEVFLQPWAKELVNLTLDAAEFGSLHLCLVWPAELHGIPLVHGVANLQRNSAGDLRGLRSLFFPGNHTSRLALQGVRVHREELTALYRRGWSTGASGTEFHASTRSSSFEALLEALNDIEIWSNPALDPTLGVLTPCFVCDTESSGWVSAARNQLDDAIRKVSRRGNRHDVREKIAAEWSSLESAPGSFLVMHNNTAKKIWKAAFAAEPLCKKASPEVAILDATISSSRSNSNAVQRVPEFVRACNESDWGPIGSVVVTDDPRTFFVLKARFAEMRIALQEHVWAAESDDALFSTNPGTEDQRPEMRSNANCKVEIVDRDATEVAVKFKRLALEVGADDHPGNRLLTEAFLYILRLSGTPCGLVDLSAELAEREGSSFSSNKFSWANIVVSLKTAIDSGILSGKRLQVERAIERAKKLVSAWGESTPMAERLLADVQEHVRGKNASLAIVLQNSTNLALARRFLERRLGDAWDEINDRLEWHTLSSFSFGLVRPQKNQHYVVVGFNQSVMRLLLTHPNLPHGTSVLLPYKQAESALITLRGMKGIDAFLPYRGRIGLLIQELDRRLKDLPPPPEFGRAGGFVGSFDFNDGIRPAASEQTYYRFDLDGGGRVFASGWVYRYVPEDDPPFRRAGVRDISEGDLIFDMSDDLRAKVEESLRMTGNWSGGTDYPERQLLKLYHDDVQARCAQFFPGATNRAALARMILEKMASLSTDELDCRPERVQYWLDLGDQADQRPHAPKEAKHFRLFCQALDIGADDAELNWSYVRSARRLSHDLGRELALRYAEILFHPESAIAYRKVPAAEIYKLQNEAVRSVFRVLRVVGPDAE